MPEEKVTNPETNDGDSANPTEPRNVVFNEEGITIIVSKDKMRAYLTLANRPGGDYSIGGVKEALTKANITNGVHDERYIKAINEKRFDLEIVVAEGTPPENGEDGSIEMAIDMSNFKKPKLNEDGTVDLKEIGTVTNVAEGDVLFRKILATKGVAGMNVHNEVIAAKPGKEAKLPKGKNTTVSEDGMELLASCAGSFSAQDGALGVIDSFAVNGDVDYSTGNIDFVGDVHVTGNVITGFTVKGAGVILIDGLVEGATIIGGGDVTISGGVQGNDKAVIESGGNLTSKFLNQCHVTAKGDVTTQAEIRYCEIRSGGSVIVGTAGSGKGVICGGTIAAKDLIQAENIGSEAGIETQLHVGISPEVLERLQIIKQETKDSEENLRKVEQANKILKSTKKQMGKMPPHKEKMFKESIKAEFVLKNQLQTMAREKEAIDTEMKELSEGKVSFSKTAYSGVTIRIGRNVRKIASRVDNTCFYLDADREIATRIL